MCHVYGTCSCHMLVSIFHVAYKCLSEIPGSCKSLALTYIQSCTQIIRPLARFYSYDYDLRKTNYIFK